jgi:hypothetical protein
MLPTSQFIAPVAAIDDTSGGVGVPGANTPVDTSDSGAGTMGGAGGAGAGDTNTSMVASSWTEALDFRSRQIYYFNTVTGETSWARPVELGATPFASGWFGRGSVSGGDANAAIIANNERWLSRPAAKQAALDPSKLQKAENNNEYNIWFGRYIGDAWQGGMGKDPAPTRCHPERDAGWTKGTLADRASFCIHFAKGACAKASECTYHHVVPTAADDAATDPARDIFGRERHMSHRSDMGGVGSMISTCRTLYVGGLRRPVDMPETAAEKVAAAAAAAAPPPSSSKGGGARTSAAATGPLPLIAAAWETLVRAQFEVWGEVENVNIITRLAVAFVRYRCRTSAEYALQSMGNQSLGNGEVLNVRWAYDDPNPAAIAAREAADTAAVTAALLARGVRVQVPSGPVERPIEEEEESLVGILPLLEEDADGALPRKNDQIIVQERGLDGGATGANASATTMTTSTVAIVTGGGAGSDFSGADAAAFLRVPQPPRLVSYESWGGRAGGGGMKRSRDETEG